MRNKAEKKLIYQLTAGPGRLAARRGVCIGRCCRADSSTTTAHVMIIAHNGIRYHFSTIFAANHTSLL